MAPNANCLSRNGRALYLLLPEPGDLRELRAHAMAAVVGLSMDAADDRVRLAAATWLHEETGRQIAEREKLEGAKGPDRDRDQREEILPELRVLYGKALPQKEEPLVVEAREARARSRWRKGTSRRIP